MIPKILAPGIACTKFKLNLAEVDMAERIFRMSIALILPTAILVHTMDIATTYIGLNMGNVESHLIPAFMMKMFGFGGFILLSVCIILLQLLFAWVVYGAVLRYKGSTRKNAKTTYFLYEFLAIVLLLIIPLLVGIQVVASNLQVIFG